jgi:hypothetical protein
MRPHHRVQRVRHAPVQNPRFSISTQFEKDTGPRSSFWVTVVRARISALGWERCLRKTDRDRGRAVPLGEVWFLGALTTA